LSVDTIGAGPAIVIVVRGELDLSTVNHFVASVDRVMGAHPAALIVLDLANVTFFCADGIRALLGVQRSVTAAAGRLVLRQPSSIVWKILTLTGLTGRFEVRDPPELSA
jgi:anti-anti-sigma factor